MNTNGSMNYVKLAIIVLGTVRGKQYMKKQNR